MEPHTPVLYVAPLLALGLIFLFFYRRFMWCLEKKLLTASKPTLQDPLLETDQPELQPRNRISCAEVLLAFLHYYTLLYLVCAYLIWDEYKSSFRLQATDYLAPGQLLKRFEEEPEPLPNWWQDEVKNMVAEDSWGLLRKLTLTAPVFLALTFLVSLLNTLRHVAKAMSRGGLLLMNPGIDSSIMIIALPMIACMMSYRSVTRMWMICCNSTVGSLGFVEDFTGKKTWVAQLVVCQNMYETNFLLMDLYESWALLHFANLALQIITASQQRLRTRQGHPLMTGGGLRHMAVQMQEKLTQSVDTLTKQGIYLFNGTCFAEASYSLITTSVEAYLGGQRSMTFNERVYRSRSRVHYFFLGMGAVASSAAIGNVVTVEMTFEEWLESFRPSAKFWSTKILLSIGFIQTLLLEIPPLSSYLSITEKDLFYASLLCIECFLLSLLHVIAWNPSESWLIDLKQQLSNDAT